MSPTVLLPLQTEVSDIRWLVAKVVVPSTMRLSLTVLALIFPAHRLVERILLLAAIPAYPLATKTDRVLAIPSPMKVWMVILAWRLIPEHLRMAVCLAHLHRKELYSLAMQQMDSLILFRSPEQMAELSVESRTVRFLRETTWKHLVWQHFLTLQEICPTPKVFRMVQPLPAMVWMHLLVWLHSPVLPKKCLEEKESTKEQPSREMAWICLPEWLRSLELQKACLYPKGFRKAVSSLAMVPMDIPVWQHSLPEKISKCPDLLPAMAA